jgi:hypothetical protein
MKYAILWLRRLDPRRYNYQGRHRHDHGTEYYRAGAVHHGGWYDEPTGAWLEVLGSGA